MWKQFLAHAKRTMELHPNTYEDDSALWVRAKHDSFSPADELDYALTGDGIMVLIEAWCCYSIMAPAGCGFTSQELRELDYWQCFGEDIVDDAFAEFKGFALINDWPYPFHPQQRLKFSHQSFDEAVDQYKMLFKKRFTYNRSVNQKGSDIPFSRIECFGVVDTPLSPAVAAAWDAKEASSKKLMKDVFDKPYTVKPHRTLHAFWLPASTTIGNMQRSLRISSAFEPTKWIDAKAYNKYCQFTNFMLLNLCREVIRQISTMFRIQANEVELQGDEKKKDMLLMPIDALLEPSLYTEWNLPTQVELILGHAEPRNWMPPVSVHLQSFLSANLVSAAATPDLADFGASTAVPFTAGSIEAVVKPKSKLKRPKHSAPTLPPQVSAAKLYNPAAAAQVVATLPSMDDFANASLATDSEPED